MQMGIFWFVQYDVIFLMKLLKNSVVNLVISMQGFPDFLSPWLSARASLILMHKQSHLSIYHLETQAGNF